MADVLNPHELRRSYRLGQKDHVSIYDTLPDRSNREVIPTTEAHPAIAANAELLEKTKDLQSKIKGLTEEKAKLVLAETKAKEDVVFLRNELARLNEELTQERAKGRTSLEESILRIHSLSEKAKECEDANNEQFDLINLQRRLLHEKDEEIRNLSELVGAHKEQVTIYQEHVEGSEIDSTSADTREYPRASAAAAYVPTSSNPITSWDTTATASSKFTRQSGGLLDTLSDEMTKENLRRIRQDFSSTKLQREKRTETQLQPASSGKFSPSIGQVKASRPSLVPASPSSEGVEEF